jgi:hypothetical protein
LTGKKVFKPEELLEYSDWMAIPIQPYPISVARFKSLLLEAANQWAKI